MQNKCIWQDPIIIKTYTPKHICLREIINLHQNNKGYSRMVSVFYRFHLAKFFIMSMGIKRRENVFYQAPESQGAGRTEEYIHSRPLSCQLCAETQSGAPKSTTHGLVTESQILPNILTGAQDLLASTATHTSTQYNQQTGHPRKSLSTLKETQQMFITGAKLLRLQIFFTSI